MDQIVQDWKEEVANCEAYLAGGEDRLHAGPSLDVTPIIGIQQLGIRFIHCLFAYISFFRMLDNGYRHVYEELNGLNHTLGLHVEHRKPPNTTELTRKLKMVRDLSIAHWASTDTDRAKRYSELDRAAGNTLWGLFYEMDPSGTCDIGSLRFGAGGVSRVNPDTGGTYRSKDRELPPLLDIHQQCASYVGEHDRVCTEYLNSIKAMLPVGVDGVEYWDGVRHSGSDLSAKP